MIKVSDLSVYFENRKESILILNNIGLNLLSGSRTAVLGESGCGKTVLAVSIMGLLPQNAIIKGCISVNGKNISEPETLNQLRGSVISMCWSNAQRFFNPLRTIGSQISESYLTHHNTAKKEAMEKAENILKNLGFENPGKVLKSYPFQLSGGMNQRAMIAMSIINSPRFLIVDEPTRGLDDDNRERVMESLEMLDDLTLLLITHDVDCARRITDDCYIMKKGCFVDSGKTGEILTHPSSPYTQQLVFSCPYYWENVKEGEIFLLTGKEKFNV